MDGRRLVMMVLGGVLLVQLIVALEMLVAIPNWPLHDWIIYRDAAQRWLAGGSYFLPYQLAGPYPVVEVEVLYPPVALILFAPFAYLPSVVWAIVPVTVTAWLIWTSRPSPIGWLVILFLLTFPQWRPMSDAMDVIGNGNPVLWLAMFVALAARYPVFGSFAWFKPTPLLLPFGLVGIRSRAWWAGLALLALACVAFGALWLDYARVLENARGLGPLYGLKNLPLVLLAYFGTGVSRLMAKGASAEGVTSTSSDEVALSACRVAVSVTVPTD